MASSVASFTASPRCGSFPLEATFTNNSTGDYDSSFWEFGDGATSTDTHPTHTYQVEGDYDVKLTVWKAASSNIVIGTKIQELHKNGNSSVRSLAFAELVADTFAPRVGPARVLMYKFDKPGTYVYKASKATFRYDLTPFSPGVDALAWCEVKFTAITGITIKDSGIKVDGNFGGKISSGTWSHNVFIALGRGDSAIGTVVDIEYLDVDEWSVDIGLDAPASTGYGWQVIDQRVIVKAAVANSLDSVTVEDIFADLVPDFEVTATSGLRGVDLLNPVSTGALGVSPLIVAFGDLSAGGPDEHIYSRRQAGGNHFFVIAVTDTQDDGEGNLRCSTPSVKGLQDGNSVVIATPSHNGSTKVTIISPTVFYTTLPFVTPGETGTWQNQEGIEDGWVVFSNEANPTDEPFDKENP